MIHNRKEIYFNTGCFAIDYDRLFNRIDYINTWAKNQNPSISPDTYKDLSIDKALYRRIIEGKQSSRFIKFKTVIGLNIFLLPSWLVLKDFARNPDRLQLWINSSIIFMENEFGKENIVKIFFNYEDKETFDNRLICRLDFIIVPLLNGELPIRDSFDFQRLVSLKTHEESDLIYNTQIQNICYSQLDSQEMDKLINNINKEEQDRVAALPPPPAKKKKHYQSSHKLPFKSCSEPPLLKVPDIGHLQISGIYHSSKITKLQTEVDRNFSQARKSPSGINSSLSFLNMDLSPNIWNLLSIEDSIGKRILEGYQGEEPLTTQVRAFNILLTGSPYDMNYIFSNSAIADNWINSSRDYIELAFGAENILRFVLHVDQGSQHIHVIVVALNSQGQLPIKNIEEKFSAIMNGYYKHMFAFRSMPIHQSTKHVNLPGESYERSRLYLEYKAALENINPYERILKKSKDFLNDFNSKKDFDDSESSEDYFDLI